MMQFGYLRDCMAKRVEGWQSKLFSEGGRETLIKAVLQASIHWKNWHALCKPKDLGGLVFRKITLFNKVLLAKQVWCIMSDPNSLVARLFKVRYCKHVDIMEAELYLAISILEP